MLCFNRRRLLLSLAASLAGSAARPGFSATSGLTAGGPIPGGLKFGPARPFSFDWLLGQARALAARPYRSTPSPAAAVIQGIDFDKVQKIRFRPEDALWRGALARPIPSPSSISTNIPASR